MHNLENQFIALEVNEIGMFLVNLDSGLMNRLLNNLTQALQTSGIDLSQANISVQIDLGKRANRRVNSSASIAKVGNLKPYQNMILQRCSSLYLNF